MNFPKKKTLAKKSVAGTLLLASCLTTTGCEKMKDIAGNEPKIGTPTPAPTPTETPQATVAPTTPPDNIPTSGTVSTPPASGESLPLPTEQMNSASSLYLRDAENSPVHWQPWSDETFAFAKSTQRPILIDLGVSWSHDAKHLNSTTFNNAEISALLNEKFVPIKVDADERPDIAARYQTAFELINKKSADFPLIVFALPDGRLVDIMGPVAVETENQKPGLKHLLNQILTLLNDNKAATDAQAKGVEDAVQKLFIPQEIPQASGNADLAGFRSVLEKNLSALEAGIPPYLSSIDYFLLKFGTEQNATAASSNLLELFRSAQRDHVLGGYFSRSPQNEIRFGKLLSVQQSFLAANLQAFVKTSKSLHKEACGEILRFMSDTFENQNGGFYSSQSPDIDETDNATYFTWTVDEISKIVSSSSDAKVFSTYLNAAEVGSNGKANLYVKSKLQGAADTAGVSYEEALKALDRARLSLTEFRHNQEKFPYVNKTIIAAWNAEMLSTYLNASDILKNDTCKEFALKTADFIINNMISEDQGVARVFYKEKPSVYGILEDNVLLASALLDCYDSTKQTEYLDGARSMMEFVDAGFLDKETGLYYDTLINNKDTNGLLKFKRISLDDGKTLNPNAVAAVNWWRLNDEKGKSRAKQMLISAMKRISLQSPDRIGWAIAASTIK